ncbi:hypothetical protein RRG08_022764 [Elysia crispata]|uniref:Fibrinogen C-terminal domain-containing protein n=1 Tax=Elysia crispata TaxID=231223 RepID=A0AAE1DP09_9GAST|nr:hypothetical protein RRG08_022764 [Elysia crispata]
MNVPARWVVLLSILPWFLTIPISAFQNESTILVLSDEKFSKTPICPGSDCYFLKIAPLMRSRLECISACHRDSLCRGATYNGSCFQLNYACFASLPCRQQPIAVVAYEKHTTCLNGGKWNSTSRQCHCLGGWVGSICERMALSCRQLQESGYQPDFYSVQLNLRNETPARPITVYCTLSPDNSVLTYLFRSTGKEEHNHTWEEYSKGYVINDGNLWLGLDNMATLSASSDYGMVGVSVILRSARQDRTFSLIYTNFSIGDFQTQYRYTVTTPPVSVSSGDLGPSYTLTDIFGPSQNTPFSTSDEDNIYASTESLGGARKSNQ